MFYPNNSQKLTLVNKRIVQEILILKTHAEWLLTILPLLKINNEKQLTLQQIKQHYEAALLEDFELFWDNKPMNTLWQSGLWQL